MSRRATDGPRWMAIPVAPQGVGGTELGLQTASLTLATDLAPPHAGGDVQSSSGRKMCGATHALQIGVAASRSPRGIGTLRSGIEAFHVVDPLGTDLHVDQAPKRAALDAVRRQVKGVGLGRDDGQREGHVSGLWASWRCVERMIGRLWRRSLAPAVASRQHAKGTRLRAVPPTGAQGERVYDDPADAHQPPSASTPIPLDGAVAAAPEHVRSQLPGWERTTTDPVCPFLRAVDPLAMRSASRSKRPIRPTAAPPCTTPSPSRSDSRNWSACRARTSIARAICAARSGCRRRSSRCRGASA